jgi:hypothetical protein
MSPRGKAKRRPSFARQGRGPRHGQGGAPRLKWLVVFALVAVCAALTALTAFLTRGAGSGEQSGPPKAAIVDQLALTFPSPAFVQDATSMLEGAGYAVDYYPGEEVTVKFYRDLPSHDYDLIIFRVHSARTVREGQPSDDVVLFTSELYEKARYVAEQKERQLGRARYLYEDSPWYFSVRASFIGPGMKGRFEGATVIMMGCDAMRSDGLAAAFVKKGADAVVGWDGSVSADHTDAATEHLLEHLLVDHHAMAEAVAQTMAEVGPDPSYGSKLVLYPAEAAASASN